MTAATLSAVALVASVTRTQTTVKPAGVAVYELEVAPLMGLFVSPVLPVYHWYVYGAVPPLAVTLRVWLWPRSMKALAGCVRMPRSTVTVAVALWTTAGPALPLALSLTRTQ